MGNQISAEKLEKIEELYSNLEKLPKLDIGNRVGGTDYIDFISLKEVEHPLMSGIDCYGRQFMVVKAKVNNKIIMQTFFKRYSDSHLWMGCGHATRLFMETSGGMSIEQIQWLIDLIKHGKATLTDKHRVNSEFLNAVIEPYSD